MSKEKEIDSVEKIGKYEQNVSVSKFLFLISACEEGQGICAHLLVIGSVLLIIVTLPFSLFFVVKVVQVLS